MLLRNPMKPHLQHSSLFAKDLPGYLGDDEIKLIFKDFPLLYVSVSSAEEDGGCNWKRHIWGDARRAKAARIQFPSTCIAEKAFAVLNLRIIPNSNPPLVLNLSPSREQFTSTFSGHPRLVKCLPPHYSDLELYTLIRQFGPLASARVDDTLGGIVQFWNEEDACKAEGAIRAVFAESLGITLQAYDPCSIVCANLSPDVDESQLRRLFGMFGLVTSVRVSQNDDKSGGRGLVSFFSPNEAHNAIHALHGTLLDSKELVLRFHEPKTTSNATEPTGAAEVARSKDQSTSAARQRPPVDRKNLSNPTPESLREEAGKVRLEVERLEFERKERELEEQKERRIFEERARKEREEAERKVAEEKEKTRLKEEERVKNWEEATRTEEERCRARDNNRQGHLAWTNAHALRRVTQLGADFQKFKFSEAQPLVFRAIPWPVLGHPATLGVGDITWAGVEAFFAYVKKNQEAVKYVTLVDIIHKLFHPDKWRARKLLESVMDLRLRESLEAAGNVVSQAVTPLWRETKEP